MDMASFLAQQQLPETYARAAQQWYIPLADDIVSHSSGATKPYIVGINGSQGSGKSTLAAFLAYYVSEHHGKNVVCLSVDDFYLSRSDRKSLAVKVHPLLTTRGVPGTHNIPLAMKTLERLNQYGTVSLPRFNKATDDPFPVTDWPVTNSPPDIIIIEGWCWGAQPQSDAELLSPENSLEAEEDALGIWRKYVNTCLKNDYQALFEQTQYWVMLKAPSFDHVYQWRCEQEHKLASRQHENASAVMSDEEVARFIQHYQRLTNVCLERLPARCDCVFELDAQRQITNVKKAQ